MILDIICVALFILMIVIGVRLGAFRMLFGLAADFVSYLAASWLSGFAAERIYTAVIRPAVNDSIRAASSDLITGHIGNAYQSLPWWLKSALSLTGADMSAGADSLSADITDTVAQAVNNAVQPIITGFVTIILTLLFYLLIRFILVRLFKKPMAKLFDMPVITNVNKFFGALLGALEALLIIMMLAYLLKLLLPHIGTESWIIDETTIYNSFIFYHFYSGNIFTALSRWITGID